MKSNLTTPGITNVSNYLNISNLGVSNWMYGNISSANYYIRFIKILTDNNVTLCPNNTPFVLANTTYCSQCSNPTPIYDANLMICVTGCPLGTTLDQNLRVCVSISTANSTNPCKYYGQLFNSSSQSC
jgi:hypothetical protein